MNRNNVQLTGDKKSKRSPRINGVQKKLLVKLIENYFIRISGHCSDVNFESIELRTWDTFADILNRRGPPKTSIQWKNCFYYMKNRIRKSVDMIRQYEGSFQENLSELDFQIFVMSQSDYFGTSTDAPDNAESNVNFNGDPDEEMGEDPELTDHLDADRKVFSHLNVDAHDEVQNSFEENYDTASQDQGDVEPKSEGSDIGWESQRVLVVESLEELQEYMDTSVIVSDEEGPQQHLTSLPSTLTSAQDEESITEVSESRGTLIVNAGDKSHESSQTQQSKTVGPVKPGTKIPEIQKERLVQLVQNNFLKAVGRFAGANGVYLKAQLWRDIAEELNTLGPPRTGEQWKTTFDSIKASAKAKLADDHNNIGGMVRKSLTRLEEKVLSIYGIDALDGNQRLGEAGFRYGKTVPSDLRGNSSTATEELSTAFSEVHRFDSDNGSRYGSISDNVNEVHHVTQNGQPLNENACNSNNNNNNTSIRQRNNDREERSDDAILSELIREIWEEPETAENYASSPAVVTENTTRNTPAPTVRALNGFTESSMEDHDFNARSRSVNHSRSARGNLTPRVSQNHVNDGDEDESGNVMRGTPSIRGSQTLGRGEPRLRVRGSSSARGRISTNIQGNENESRNISRGPTSVRGSQNRVRGVPRLRFRGRGRGTSSASGRFSPITNINQFFNDGDGDDEDEAGNIGNQRTTDTTVAPLARDRSNLRHRYTSYEMVSRSVDAQEEFIDRSMRNHSEMMFATERNHMEMLGIMNSTLRALTNVAQEFVNKM